MGKVLERCSKLWKGEWMLALIGRQLVITRNCIRAETQVQGLLRQVDIISSEKIDVYYS